MLGGRARMCAPGTPPRNERWRRWVFILLLLLPLNLRAVQAQDAEGGSRIMDELNNGKKTVGDSNSKGSEQQQQDEKLEIESDGLFQYDKHNNGLLEQMWKALQQKVMPTKQRSLDEAKSSTSSSSSTQEERFRQYQQQHVYHHQVPRHGGGGRAVYQRRHALLQNSLHHHRAVQLRQFSEKLNSNTSIRSNKEENDTDADAVEADGSDDSKTTVSVSDDGDDKNSSHREQIFQRTLEDANFVHKFYLHQPEAKIHNAFFSADRSTSLSSALPPFPPSARRANLQLIRNMFQHGYDAYMYHGWPSGEVHPLTCSPAKFDLIKLPALTVIDSLDTLVVLGNYTEFARAVERLRNLHHSNASQPLGLFDVDENVSVFETNIRILGGLLSAHQMAIAYLSNKVPLKHVFRDGTGNKPDVLIGCEKNEGGTVDTMIENTLKSVNHDQVVGNDAGHDIEKLERNNVVASAAAVDDEIDDKAICRAAVAADGSGSDDSKAEDGPVLDFDHPPKFFPVASGASAIDGVFRDDTNDPKNKKGKKVNTTKTSRTTTSTKRKQEELPQWEYDGFLLDLALDMGNRLFPAFATKTGIPYGTVNLRTGVPKGETTGASLAGAGTLTLEFELLSRLTGQPKFGKAAKLASRALWLRRSSIDLMGKHIDVQSGAWTETLSGIGSNSDSFLEYLIKQYTVFVHDEDFWLMMLSAYSGVNSDNRVGEWYADVEMSSGLSNKPSYSRYRTVLESLMAFYPGMQVLAGEIAPAARTLNSFFLVRELLGFLPERFNFGQWTLDQNGLVGAAKHPLRPELLESCYFLHLSTAGMSVDRPASRQQQSKPVGSFSAQQTSGWLWAADFALHKLESAAKATCGYAGIRDMNPVTSGSVDGTTEGVRHIDEMPSFFLSETLKYLYLSFDTYNAMHSDDDLQWVFTTEAHPIHFSPNKETAAGTNIDAGGSANSKEQEKTPYENELLVLKELLKDRLKKVDKKSQNLKLKSQYSDRYFSEEKWSQHTRQQSYGNNLMKFTTTVANREHQLLKSRQQNNYEDEDLCASDMVQAFIPQSEGDHTVHLLDSFEDTHRNRNFAHLALANHGVMSKSYFLKRSCPNLYSTDWLWLHALSGGATDYSELYLTTMKYNQDNPAATEHPFYYTVLGAAEALGFLGSGVYLGQIEVGADDYEVSPVIVTDKEAKEETDHHFQPKEEVKGVQGNAAATSGSKDADVVEIQSNMGLFEITSFENGGGFYIHHVDSGETIVTTFLMNEGNPADSFVLTYAAFAHSSSTKGKTETAVDDQSIDQQQRTRTTIMGSRWTSVFDKKVGPDDGASNTQEVIGEEENVIPERRVVMADFVGNAFTCKIDLVEKQLVHVHHSGDEEEDDADILSEKRLRELDPDFVKEGTSQHLNEVKEQGEGNVLMSYPCAPALFGPAHITALVEELPSTGLTVEAPIQAPPTNDEFGCQNVSDSDNLEAQSPCEEHETFFSEKESDQKQRSCCTSAIQVVHRGDCTFHHKAVAQKKVRQAAAVIVVNTEEDELFAMSGHNELEAESVDTGDVPVTVLVTGLDGEDLLGNAAEYTGNDPNLYIVARIIIERQDSSQLLDDTEEGENILDDFPWPAVKGSKDGLQVLSKSGWGVQAIQHKSENEGENGESDWQLLLLRHS